MQNVSNEYKQSMQGTIRNQSLIKIAFSIVDQEAQNNITLTANSNETYSDLENINNGYEVEQSYITMEKGRYTIGSNQVIYDNTDYLTQGWVSDVVADGNGEFQENPTITINANQTLSTIGFTFNFDNVCNEYPLEIRIYAYLDGVLIHDNNYSISSYETSLEARIEAWNKVVVEYVKVLPFHRARMDSIIFGITKLFENDMVINANMVRQCSPIANEIAQNSFEFEIENFNQEYNPDNPDNIYRYVEEEQEVKVDFGYRLDNARTEWVKGGVYVLDGSPTINKNTVKFRAVDMLGNLTDIYYKGLYRTEPISMYDLAKDVLTDAGLSDREYVLDDYMKTIFTKAHLPVVSHKECLQIIANASQCLLYVNRDGKIAFDMAIDPTVKISDSGGIKGSSSALAYNSPDLITETVITMEKDFWHIGDNMVISDDDIKQGFVSESISNASGTFEINPSVVIEYSSGISLYEIPLKFGSIAHDFNVYYYSGGELINSLNVANNEQLEYTILKQVHECTKVEIEIVRVKPYQRARINAIGTGRVNDFYLDFNTSKSVPIVKKQAPLYAIDVNCYSWSVGEAKEIFKETVAVNGSIVLKIQYNPSCDITIATSAGFTTTNEIYTSYAIITLSGNGECELTITGNELIQNSIIVSNIVGLKGETKTLENPLITDMTNAERTSVWIADWLTKRNEYNIDYRGNPEIDAYDTVYAQSQFEEYFPVRVVKNEIKFNGALSGTINARRI